MCDVGTCVLHDNFLPTLLLHLHALAMPVKSSHEFEGTRGSPLQGRRRGTAIISPPPASEWSRRRKAPDKQACVALTGSNLGANYWSRAGFSYFNMQLLTGLAAVLFDHICCGFYMLDPCCPKRSTDTKFLYSLFISLINA